MGIKASADKIHFDNHPKEREHALIFDEAFDITHGNTHGELSYWLADPKTHTRERFGFNNEVLIIYSPHPKTDARVLTSIENISRMPEFKHRIDKVVVFLVHKGDITETNNLLLGTRDRIIVPFHSSELLDRSRGSIFIRSRISEIIGTIDLFGMSSPIKSESYFFGRDDLVQKLINRSIISNESSGLFGLRKTGKTSVLYAIQRRIADRPILTEYLDCQNPGVHAARWWQVLENIIGRLVQSTYNNFKRSCKISGGYNQINAGSRFSSDVKTILADGQLSHIILMLDEIEYITPNLSGALGQHWDSDFLPFWQTVRSTHQETLGKLSFIVAGVNPSCVEQSHFKELPNPIFQLAIPQYLEPFSDKNISHMVRSIGRYAGIKFEDSAYVYLKNYFGGHPYLIRLACSEVWKVSDKEHPDRLTVLNDGSFKDRRDSIKARLAQPIKDILLSLVWWYPEEYDLLRILASGDSGFVNEYLKGQKHYFVQFAKYGLLKDSGEFAITDLKDFLNIHGESYKKEISPFIRGDMPPELLPEVPDIEVLGKLFGMRCAVEIGLRKAIMLYLGVRYNWDNKKISDAMIAGINKRPDRQSPADLFVGKMPKDVINDLFTLDLKSIIAKNWDLFTALFDNNKIRFEMNMDTINKARRVDGHTKPFTDIEIEEFNNSYSWILGRLAKVP